MRKLRETVVVGIPPLVTQDRWICKGGGAQNVLLSGKFKHSDRRTSRWQFHYGSSSLIFTCCMSIYRLLGTTNSFLGSK